jgi:hypothetical protein
MIDKHYSHYCSRRSDINEHMPTLYQYALECKHITEMGVRDVVSTWAFLKANPTRLISYDIMRSKNIDNAIIAAKEKGIEFEFHQKNVLNVDIEDTDLLFIDTLHQHDQLTQELNLHADKVRKYIIFHDTSKFAYTDEVTGNKGGLWPAIETFLSNHPEWQIKERYTNNNGLTIIERL